MLSHSTQPFRRVVAFVFALPFFCAAPDAVAGGAQLIGKSSAGNITQPGWVFYSAGENLQPDSGGARWSSIDGRVIVAIPASDAVGAHYAVAAYTVPVGAAGFYSLADTLLLRDAAKAGEIDLRVLARRGGDAPTSPPAVSTRLGAGEMFDFDCFLGYLNEGDTIFVAIGPSGDTAAGDSSTVNFRVDRSQGIAVAGFPADIQDGAWSLAAGIPTGSASARELNFGRDNAAAAAPLALAAGGTSESVVSFRAPQSGYYALHGASLTATGASVTANIYAGGAVAPRGKLAANPGAAHAGLGVDIGYVAKGELVHIVLSAPGSAAIAEFSGSIVEWAPRRAPIRVRRGTDGRLDVYEPENPRRAVDIPAEKWVTVSAVSGDATTAIRNALTQAKALQQGTGYAGVRLTAGHTYTIASSLAKGAIFTLTDAKRLVFDGNGATLHVAAPAFARESFQLFTCVSSTNIAFADCDVTAASVPFATGEILSLNPASGSTQTVTFRVDPGSAHPTLDISTSGNTSGYAYDPKIPGRLAFGTWTHYPASGNPCLLATGTEGIFTHKVTRTNSSIRVGDKWLVKNKGGGLIYLVTRTGSENITLSGINGRACGGGILRFWQTSGINILDCRFEPDGGNWISSSADGVHGRGREGVWIENTIIRGVCEDIMNTYGLNMTTFADDNPDDATMTIYMRPSSSELEEGREPWLPAAENIASGDRLVFFDPNTGRIIGQASVLSISFSNGRITLSNPVSGIVPWSASDVKSATVVYNTRIAGRFFVRDSRFMDSMRIGIYVKARGGAIFGSQLEGLSAPGVYAANEPEWPEGPPPTHLWVQGCLFSNNNTGYMPRHRDFIIVDPADFSSYTRRFRSPGETDDYRAYVVSGQYSNSHMKIIGNVFHDWRGMGISVRNARNARVEDNIFLPPVDDNVMRAELDKDPVLAGPGTAGAYAGIHLDSVVGARVTGNRFHGLLSGDLVLARGVDVREVIESDNTTAATPPPVPAVALSFDEWLGATGGEGRVELNGAHHGAGRLGAGLRFTGGAPAVLAASPDFGGHSFDRFTLALWVCGDDITSADTQTVVALGDAQNGASIELAAGRWRAVVRRNGSATSLDLGPVTPGLWRHLALVFDGPGNAVRAYADGVQLSSAGGAGASIALPETAATLGANYKGALDEFRFYSATLTPGDLVALTFRGAR